MSRGELRWQIAVPEDGALPFSGVLPAAIQWGAAADGTALHPCDRLPDSGCQILALDLSHPAAVLGTSGIVGMFRELRIVGPVNLRAGPVQLSASISTPVGVVSL